MEIDQIIKVESHNLAATGEHMHARAMCTSGSTAPIALSTRRLITVTASAQ